MKDKRKRNILIIIVVIMLIIATIFLARYLDQRHKDEIYAMMRINFIAKTKIEYGDDIKSEDLILNHEGGELSVDKEIDPFKVGEQELTFTLQNEGIKRDYSIKVDVVDTKAPKIVLKKERVELEYGADFNALDNVESVSDVIDGKIEAFEDNEYKDEEGYYYQSDVDPLKAGEYEVKVYAYDKNGNESTSSYEVAVKEKIVVDTSPSVDYGASGGYGELGPADVSAPTYIGGILLVNKSYPLPISYGSGLDKTALNAFYDLQAAAKKAGHNIPLVSGFRSYDTQYRLYSNYVARDGQALADTYSARPGHSEHQSGLAMDVGAIDNNYGNTDAGRWLEAHCAEYGFILRYLKGKEHITGYQYEPWHIRYVGKDIALSIMSQGITLEEYLGLV